MPPLAAPSLVRNPERLPAHRRPGRIKASDQGDRRRCVRPDRVAATGSPRSKSSLTLPLPRIATSPTRLC